MNYYNRYRIFREAVDRFMHSDYRWKHRLNPSIEMAIWKRIDETYKDIDMISSRDGIRFLVYNKKADECFIERCLYHLRIMFSVSGYLPKKIRMMKY